MTKVSIKKSTIVPFRLTKIQTLEFAIVEKSFSDREDVQVSQAFNFSFDSDTHQVGIAPRYEFFQTSPFMIVEVLCIFTIDSQSWNSWMNTNKEILVIPKNIATHMAVLSVGTARGVLHAKTEGSYFNIFVLPTWNLSSIIKENLEINSGVI